jgi:hypothetical protein
MIFHDGEVWSHCVIARKILVGVFRTSYCAIVIFLVLHWLIVSQEWELTIVQMPAQLMAGQIRHDTDVQRRYFVDQLM